MALEISGKLISILPEQTGSSQRGNWVKQNFVIETQEQYPKKICLMAWNDKVDILHQFKEGDVLKIAINIESREYNNKWYTDVKAWKMEKAGDISPNENPGMEHSAGSDPGIETSAPVNDDLPF